MELSRDIEPMEGGYEDNFYLQLIRNVRAFKDSGEPLEENGVRISCDINSPESFEKGELYVKIGQKPSARDHYGCTKELRYTAEAARNTLNKIYAANDADKLYFRIDAYDAFAPFSSCDNTCLYLGCGSPALKGYYSYEYVIKRIAKDKMALYTLDENGAATFVKVLDCAANGKSLTFALELCDIAACDRVYFKATDSVVMDDIMKTYTTGSAMPMGRLSYEYKLK